MFCSCVAIYYGCTLCVSDNASKREVYGCSTGDESRAECVKNCGWPRCV